MDPHIDLGGNRPPDQATADGLCSDGLPDRGNKAGNERPAIDESPE